MGKPIYYMTAKATFIKKKSPLTRLVWIVSSFDSPLDIMRSDIKTMSRLRSEMYSKSAKKKVIVIDEILTKKKVGTTNH